MTHIVEMQSKKELRKRLKGIDGVTRTFNEHHLNDVFFRNPSMGIIKGAWQGWASQMEVGQELEATNHPKRSFFAKIKKIGAWEWRVS